MPTFDKKVFCDCPMAMHGFQLSSFVIRKVLSFDLLDHPGSHRAPCFRWKAFFLLWFNSYWNRELPAVENCWNYTHLKQVSGETMLFFVETTPQDFKSFHIYELHNEIIRLGDSDTNNNNSNQPIQLEFQVCRCSEWDLKSLHKIFIKSFQSSHDTNHSILM